MNCKLQLLNKHRCKGLEVLRIVDNEHQNFHGNWANLICWWRLYVWKLQESKWTLRTLLQESKWTLIWDCFVDWLFNIFHIVALLLFIVGVNCNITVQSSFSHTYLEGPVHLPPSSENLSWTHWLLVKNFLQSSNWRTSFNCWTCSSLLALSVWYGNLLIQNGVC